MKVETVLNPAEILSLPSRDLKESTCVVFDVLRATSTMLTAFANGARRIYPVLTPDEARLRRKDDLPQALLGGERHGLRIDGFDLGNSPLEHTREAISGRDVITTTTNGTVALRACAGAGEIIAGAWLNLAVLAGYLRQQAIGKHLLLVCAGTGDRFALEDGLTAGALFARLEAAGVARSADDATLAMRALYQQHAHDPLAAMQNSENGRRLMAIGLERDVEWCASTAGLPWIATMHDGALTGKSLSLASMKP